MKKLSLLLVLVLLFGLTACGQKEPVSEEPPAPEEPLRLESLAVEISKGDLDPQQLSAAVKELPEVLRASFADMDDVEIGQVTVTVGSSASATVQALKEGHVDLAFLPAEEALRDGAGVLLADAQKPQSDGDYREAGTSALLCAAATPYGSQLTERSKSGNALTWDELVKARWGISKAGAAYRCFDLWLAENFDGKRAAELPQVTLYEDDTTLLGAALAGEVDALALRRESWTQAEDAAGADSVSMLAETELLCTQVAAVSPEREDLTQARFAAALEQALLRLEEEHPELMAALGAPRFIAAKEEDLASMSRLLALEEQE